MELKKPIFIIGSGRSGSTVFHEILSEHPDFYWLSNLSSIFPRFPVINKTLMMSIDLPIINHVIKRVIKPSESWNFWECYSKSFVDPIRDIVSSDVTIKEKREIKNALFQLSTKRRNRFLGKIVGWPRVGFIQEIFNDVKFIHIIRDGRAVVNSIINVDWWQGWRGPSNWQRPDLTPAQKEEWQKYNESFIALAAIEWKILMDAHEKAKEKINNNNFLEIRYENLCADPVDTLKKAIEFCELDWSTKLYGKLKKVRLNSANNKYKNDLTKDQIEILENVLHLYLMKYGYE